MSRDSTGRGAAQRLLVALALAVHAPAAAQADTPTGIYALSTARNNPNTATDERLANIRSYDFVSGYTLRVFWADIEPALGQYNFDVIDNAIQTLAPLSRGLSLEILTAEEPQYVLAGAAATYTDHRGGTTPVPWDAFAQQRHAALFTALGNHVVAAAGAPHPLSQDPTLKSIDAAPVGLNFGVRDLNNGIRNHPDYTQQRYIDAVVAGVAASAAAFPYDANFLAFFAFDDGEGATRVDAQLIDRLAAQYNGPGQTQLALFAENLSDDFPTPIANGTGTGNNFLDWVEAGGSTMMQALDSWLQHQPDRDPQLDSRNPATGIELAHTLYGTRFVELYIADIDGAAEGALDAAGRPLVDDLRAWNAQLTVDADFDDSTAVNNADLTRWTAGFGLSAAATNFDGDADGDRDVDGHDFVLWQRRLGTPTIAVAAVPEPQACALALLAAVALPRKRLTVAHRSPPS